MSAALRDCTGPVDGTASARSANNVSASVAYTNRLPASSKKSATLGALLTSPSRRTSARQIPAMAPALLLAATGGILHAPSAGRGETGTRRALGEVPGESPPVAGLPKKCLSDHEHHHNAWPLLSSATDSGRPTCASGAMQSNFNRGRFRFKISAIPPQNNPAIPSVPEFFCRSREPIKSFVTSPSALSALRGQGPVRADFPRWLPTPAGCSLPSASRNSRAMHARAANNHNSGWWRCG